jgi:hypothetical protein
MKKYRLPTGPRPAPLPLSVAFQLATACPEPPAGEGWFYEVKHDGHRIAALADGRGGLRLLSRNGSDRTTRFAAAVGRSRRAPCVRTSSRPRFVCTSIPDGALAVFLGPNRLADYDARTKRPTHELHKPVNLTS